MAKIKATSCFLYFGMFGESKVCVLLFRLQMTEAALALSEQKAHDLGELLTRVKMEKNELRDRQSREIKKEQEVFRNCFQH